MYLYFNGDSYIAGAELGDSILPDYPGLIPRQDYLRPGYKSEWFTDVKKRRENHKENISKLEFERSFPYKVSTKLNLPFTNAALGGSSMDRIVRTTVADLIELRKTLKDEKILAFLGVTSFTRREIAASPTADTRRNNLSWRMDFLPENNEATDYHALVKFYKNIIFVQDFCKSNDISLFWVNFWHLELEKYNYTDKDFIQFKNYANLTYTFDINEHYNNFDNQKIVCPGGHLGEIVHDYIADNLVEFIKSIP